MISSDWLASRVHASPHQTALIIDDSRWTYAELDQLVNGVCARLLDLGVEPGQFVGVLMPNGREYVCLIHALARLGAILVPLNTRLSPPELAWQIEHVGCKLVLCARKLAEKLSLVNCQLSFVNEAWLDARQPLTIHHSPFTIHHLQAIVFTSGTSGKPKGAMLTFANHFYSALASAYTLGVLPSDVWLSCLPLYHVGGLAVVWRSCLAGTAVDLHPRFDLDAIHHSLNHNPITLISLVPTMLQRLLNGRDHWPASLRLILLGGAAAQPELVTRANALPRRAVKSEQLKVNSEAFTIHDSQFIIHNSPLVAPTYGLTEAASQVATMLPEEAAAKPGSVGKPLLFTAVKIVDDNGDILPANSIGEIVVSGPTVMAGYVAANEPPAISYQPLASFPTGDLGYLDDDGDLWIVQRRSDLILSGGENIYPAEVEAVLMQHTAVTLACVVGLPDAEWGQTVAAMVVLAEGTAVTAVDLNQFCRERLAGYKQPRLIQFAKALPLNATGKIDRTAVIHLLTHPQS